MPLTVHQFACLSDNYGFLVRDDATGMVACIDTPDADVILRELARFGGRLDYIFNTHWHPDHAGGNAAVKNATGAIIVAPEEVRRASAIDRLVAPGDRVELGETGFQVLDGGGHTLGHILFHAPDAQILFAGDTLFPMGCGRLFEGTPAQMWASLSRIAALDAATTVYSAHEYALANASFALSVDPDPAVRMRADAIREARAKGMATVPTTIGVERATNPFLRAPALPVTQDCVDAVDAFARIRAMKDSFRN